MTESQRLLAKYVQDGSEAAFREIADRYLDLTYSTALRLVGGDAHLAQDVTQAVFIDLARTAGRLSREVMLGGWLHRHTCFVAGKVLRSERRRAARERQAVEMNALRDDPQVSLSDLAPVLDDAINQLGAGDRAAILLRFFEQRDFRSIGETLGTSENTARMRVNRALEKLGTILKRRGICCSAAALGTTLATGTVAAAPAGVSAVISSAAVAGAASGAGTTFTLLNLMSLTKLQLGAAVLIIAGVMTTFVLQQQAQRKLREQNVSLQKQVVRLENEKLAYRATQMNGAFRPRLPVPPFAAVIPTAVPVETLQSTNLYNRLSDLQDRLTASQVESYLKDNGRNAASLLAAYRTTGDQALLTEAMQKFPADPQVAFEALFRAEATPEERRHWVNALQSSAPDNALPDYLSALDYFKAGQADQAVEELIVANGKSKFQDYALERDQADEEAYLAAGHSVSEAKVLASLRLLLPQLRDMKVLSEHLIELFKSYQRAGDQDSAQAVLQITVGMGLRYGDSAPGEALISQLVGFAIERNALKAMDPKSPYGNSGLTVQDRLNQIAGRNDSLKELARQTETIAPKMSEQDWVIYKDRWKLFGEEAAERWLINKYGRQ